MTIVEDSTAGSTVHLPPTPHSLEEDGEEEKGEEAERVVAGVLVVEEFNWKSIATNMPLLRLVTSGVKGAVVKLDIRLTTTLFYRRKSRKCLLIVWIKRIFLLQGNFFRWLSNTYLL